MKRTQMQMWQQAEQRSADANSVFIEIQQGPNPLTDAEIEKLIVKNPDHWERFRGMGINPINIEGGAK